MPAVLLLVGFGPISGTHQEGDPLTREPSHASIRVCLLPLHPLSRYLAVPILQKQRIRLVRCLHGIVIATARLQPIRIPTLFQYIFKANNLRCHSASGPQKMSPRTCGPSTSCLP